MPTLVPYLTFRDADASLGFLRDVLGFEIVTEQRDDAGGLVHAELTRGEALIMGGPGDLTPAASPGIYLVVDEVEPLFEAATAAGAGVVFPPESTEWGTSRARITDLDGHEWTVGTYQPGQSW